MSEPGGWIPDDATIAEANLTRFMAWLAETGRGQYANYQELWRKSVDDIEWFWDAVVKTLGIEFSTPYQQVLDATDPPFAKWFVGGRLNLANDCVFKHARGRSATHPAIIWEGEDEGQRRLTYADLKRDVAMLADALDRMGVQSGDRIESDGSTVVRELDRVPHEVDEDLLQPMPVRAHQDRIGRREQ